MSKIFYDLKVTYKDGETEFHRRITYNELLMRLTYYMNWHIKDYINIKEIVID